MKYRILISVTNNYQLVPDTARVVLAHGGRKRRAMPGSRGWTPAQRPPGTALRWQSEEFSAGAAPRDAHGRTGGVAPGRAAALAATGERGAFPGRSEQAGGARSVRDQRPVSCGSSPRSVLG